MASRLKKHHPTRRKGFLQWIFLVCLILIGIYAVLHGKHVAMERRLDSHLQRETGRRIVLVSFSSGVFEHSMHHLAKKARQIGWFTDIELWNPSRLRKLCPKSLASDPTWVEAFPRGYGLWAWKPSIIQFTLQLYRERFPHSQVVLFYLDAGCALNNAPERFFQYVNMALNTGGVVFELPYLNKDYCKKYTLETINQSLANAHQLVGGIIALNVHADASHRAINEWENWTQYSRGELLKDPSSEVIQHPNFVVHRHDQAIWSLVARKYGFKVLQDETWHGPEWKSNDYPIWAMRRKMSWIGLLMG